MIRAAMTRRWGQGAVLLGLLSAVTGTTAGPVEGAQVHASFDFEDGLQGWTVIDRVSGASTWVHTADGHQSSGAIAISPYADNSSSVIVSPPIDAPEGSVLVFDARYWLEDSSHGDWVVIRDHAAGSDVVLVPEASPRLLTGRGRAPHWDQYRYVLNTAGTIEIAFDLHTNDYCSGSLARDSARWRIVYTNHCGDGVTIDNVRVVSAAMASTMGPAWGDAEGTSAMTPPSGDGDPGALANFLVTGAQSRQSTRPDDEFADQRANEAYQQAWLDRGPIRDLEDWRTDPLVDWDDVRGRRLDTWFDNRYRTPLGARLFAPLEDGTYPLLVFLGGAGSANWPGYFPMLQRLAEEGHVVLSVAWQGDGIPSMRWSPLMPAPEYCADPEATAAVWWRQPQEAGYVETQHCAGTTPPPTPGDADQFAQAYEVSYGAPTTFTAIDAVDWALSDANPWRQLVDADQVGTIGHSAGAMGATVAAQVDERIDAALIIDGYGRLPGRVPPTTPVLSVAFDGYGTAVSLAGNPQSVALELRDAGIDAGFLYLRNTSHFDLAWEPEQSLASDDAVRTAGNHGTQRAPLVKPMIQHWALAWFDLHLRDDQTASVRLTADTFDASADRTAQGTGRWDPNLGNLPYTIEGTDVQAQLNDVITSFMHLNGSDTVLAGGEPPLAENDPPPSTEQRPSSEVSLPATGGGVPVSVAAALATVAVLARGRTRNASG